MSLLEIINAHDRETDPERKRRLAALAVAYMRVVK
jgi:hypothetical protein